MSNCNLGATISGALSDWCGADAVRAKAQVKHHCGLGGKCVSEWVLSHSGLGVPIGCLSGLAMDADAALPASCC